MPPARYLAALIVATLFLPGHAAAQDQESCTYRACALRMQGSNILAGIEGERITSFGFLSAPRLRPWMAVSDSVDRYIGIVEANHVSGQVLSLVGSILWIGGLLALKGWDGDNQRLVALGAGATGVALFTIGNTRVRRARDAMQSAIWWYNEHLAVSPETDALGAEAPVLAPPGALPGTHARAGAAVGFVAGTLGGLVATRGLDSSRTAEGLSITLVMAAVGTLIGHHVGKAIER